MMKTMTRFVLLALLASSTVIHAKPTEYIRDYDYQATRFDSEYTSRINAIDGAKQELLNEIGTHISSVIRVSKDSSGNSFFAQDTVMLTAGIISMQILNELWDRKIYSIKANMKVDPDEVKQSLKQLREDQQLENQLRNSLTELNDARQQISDLRAQLEHSQDSVKTAALAGSYLQAAKNIEVEEAFLAAIRASRQGDFEQAFVGLHELALQDYGKAQQRLGFMYERGMVVKQDYSKAREWYLKANENGDADALAQLGFLHERGLGVDKDLDKAIALYRQAIEKGSKQAYAQLGYLYQSGQGVDKDLTQALQLYRQGADHNHPFAIARLAFFYQQGWGVEQDLDKALALYQQAAKTKQPFAMAKLGFMYLKGLGVAQDHQIAAELIRESARYNSPLGLSYLGFLYEQGISVEQDYATALDYYQQSIDVGSAFGEFRLGVMYLKGWGVRRDRDKALELLQKADAKGIQKAGEIAQRIAARMKRNNRF